jgi:hypothetical protein
VLKRSDIEIDQTGLSIFRVEKLLDNSDDSYVFDIQQYLLEHEPDIVRIKIRSDASQINALAKKLWGKRVQYIYSIKRYAFPASTFGSFHHRPINYQLVTEHNVHEFKAILRQSWEHHFLGYRYNDMLSKHITPAMELEALIAYYKRFIPGDPAGHQLWLIKEGSDYVGTCCFFVKSKELDVMLAGILPEYRQKGYFYQLSVAGRLLAIRLNKAFITNGVRTNNQVSLRFFDQWQASQIVYEDVYCIIHPRLMQ